MRAARPGTVWTRTPPTPEERAAYADAEPRAFWLDGVAPRAAQPAVVGREEADLLIVGGGFTGLWAALRAKEQDPGRDVVLVEAQRVGFGASSRNGGFAVASLTHGTANGAARFAAEMPALERLSLENFEGLCADVDRYAIPCALQRSGELMVATEPHQVAWLDEEAEALAALGHDVVRLDGEAMRAEVASPLYRGGVWDRTGAGVLDPARLVDGLLAAALRAGVRVFEHAAVEALRDDGSTVVASLPQGRLTARRVLLATSATTPLLAAMRRRVVPVYDYVLMTEPLTTQQRESIGWRRGQGIGDMGNRFHYTRMSADGRILWGGYEAVYRYGGPVRADLDEDEAVFAALSHNFFTTFPQLRGVRFTHRWGGAIDTCSRFSVFFGRALGGKAAWAVGYTGLGVAASRFGGRTALDLLDGTETEATRLRYVRDQPLPFPPEPLRWAAVQLTRNRLAAADDAAGRRGAWLRTLDRLGLGFDS